MKKIALIYIIILGLITGGFVMSQTSEDLGGVLPPFYYDGTNILPRDVTWGLRIPALVSCDTIDTNASGTFACGTDDSGGGAGQWSTTTGGIYYLDNVAIGGVSSTAPFWFSTSTGDLTITGNLSSADSFLTSESDPIWVASSSNYVAWADASTTLWDTAYSWGDWSGKGFLTSVAYSDLTGYPADVITAGTGLSWSASTTLNWSSTGLTWAGNAITNAYIASSTEYLADTDTTYSATGTLLDLTGTVFSINEGTMTDTKYCIYTSGTGIVCNSVAGGDTFAIIEEDGSAISTNAPTLDFDGTTFSIVEDPTDSFDININKGNLTEATSSVLTITGGTSAILSNATIEVDTDLHNWSWTNVVDSDITDTLSANAVAITDDLIVAADFAHSQDWGEIVVGGAGQIALDSNCVAAAEMAEADHGEIKWDATHVATIDYTEVTLADFTNDGNYATTGVTTLSNLISIGTIGTGVWEGNAIGYAYGGTGKDLTAYTGILRVDSGVFSTTTAGSGTVTSVDISVPTGWTIADNPITTAGTLALDYDAGYSAVLDASTTNWETAYSWGDWSGEGFLDSPILAAEGGTGLDTSGWTGFVKIDGGTWTTSSIDISDDTNLAFGRSITGSGDSIEADAELYVFKAKIAFENPVATDDFFFGEIAIAVTFTSIYCKTLVGTVNLDVSIAGSDINGTDITCNTSGVLDESLGGDTAGAVGEELALVVTSVASSPTYLMVQVNGQYND